MEYSTQMEAAKKGIVTEQMCEVARKEYLEPEQLRELLSRSGLPLYGTALRQDTVDVRAVDYSRCALAIGSEGKGLSQQMLEF